MRQCVTLLVLGVLTASAVANGGMGYGFERYLFFPWLTYCVVMVVSEAVLIGRSLQTKWWVAGLTSLLANLSTAFLCPCFLAPFIQMFRWGPPTDPHPFPGEIFAIAGLTLVSAFVEAIVWQVVVHSSGKDPKSVRKASLLAHGALLPIGLVILLAPERPYPMFDYKTDWYRSNELLFLVHGLPEDARWPVANSAEEFVRKLEPERADSNWVLAYTPEYHRFDMGESRRRPIAFNRGVCGTVRGQTTTWLFRGVDTFGQTWEMDTDGHIKPSGRRR